jgi:hypothetical protein
MISASFFWMLACASASAAFTSFTSCSRSDTSL